MTDLELLPQRAQRAVMQRQGMISQALQGIVPGNANDQPPIVFATACVSFLDLFSGGELHQSCPGGCARLELPDKSRSHSRHSHVIVIKALASLYGNQFQLALIRAIVEDCRII